MPAPFSPSTVGIIGLGLMGGSLARELAARGVEILGYDPDPNAMSGATESGILHSALPASLAGLEAAELLVVAVPVGAAGKVIARAMPHLAPACVVTDLGSTKRSIEAVVLEIGIAERFVGSHPLTGGHRSGWSAAHRDLYAWSRVFLCPTTVTREESLDRVRDLWLSVGALPEVVGAAEHDQRVAWTSHLPQLASTALSLALDGAGEPRRDLGPGGRDTTRLAASSPEMWSAICVDNADLLIEALQSMERELARLRGAITAGDEEALREIFGRARAWAEDRTLPG